MKEQTKPSAGALRAAEYIESQSRQAAEKLGFYDLETFALAIDRETNLVQLEADSKKLREPATCNAGHKSLPLALWDCPVCTQLLRDQNAELLKAAKLLEQAIAKCERNEA